MPLPPLPDSFYWTHESWGAALRCRPLGALAPHVFTTRQLALSLDTDLASLATAVSATEVVMLTQVHGRDVVTLRRGEPLPQGRPAADALVSDVPGIAVAVRAADCVPLLVAARAGWAVAAEHAGCRGSAARAAGAFVYAMRAAFSTNPSDLVVAIGPSIGPCCYEVGTDVVDAFAVAGHERYLIDRWFTSLPPRRGSRERKPLHLDVAGANRDQLILAGVPEEQIFACGLCTAMHLDVLTSYRAETEKAGRIAGVIAAR
jgi:YfiH family protein